MKTNFYSIVDSSMENLLSYILFNSPEMVTAVTYTLNKWKTKVKELEGTVDSYLSLTEKVIKCNTLYLILDIDPPLLSENDSLFNYGITQLYPKQSISII